MIIEIKIPSPGESVTEVQLAEWLAEDGSFIEKDAEIAMIDSDKASFALYAEEGGQLKHLAKAGDTLKVGQVIGKIDNTVHSPQSTVNDQQPAASKQQTVISKKKNISSLAARMIEKMGLDENDIINNINKPKISKEDVLEYIKTRHKTQDTSIKKENFKPETKKKRDKETVREKMSTLRLKLSQRLVAVKNETAMLTTFNEINMGAVIKIRNQHKEAFKLKYGVSLGMTSFFAKASAIALQEFPIVNAMIDGDEVVYNKFVDLGIAVSSPKGLIVPIIRNAQLLTLTETELKINELAEKTRNNRISIEELTGGTFTITNGGIFGSLLSTPILNPPQSAILGMHNIVERPIAVKGKVEIAPMMYLALSYDHRIIDGKDSVTFLMRIKQLLENPLEKLIDLEEFRF